jgi:hypothetical protein
VRVAYQSPIHVTFKGETAEALSYTLEDAIVMANLNLFETLPGAGLIAKFRTAIADSTDLNTLSGALKAALEGGGKAEFALDLLEINDPASLKPPAYIKDGLLWLVGELEHKQVELGLVQIAGNDDVTPVDKTPAEVAA